MPRINVKNDVLGRFHIDASATLSFSRVEFVEKAYREMTMMLKVAKQAPSASG
jgi:hypothetical protein